jgi:hypothetical protein
VRKITNKEGEMMKKILSFLAMIAVIGGSMMSTTSCFGGGKNSSSEYIAQEEKVLMGTTGAKIALARERLDENVFSEEMSFWGTEESKAATSGRIAETATARLARQRAKATSSQQACTVVGDKVRWTQFDNNSLTMENFENVFNEIELDASQVAESIGRIKKYVGVTDKWIGGDQLLLVEENREILVEKFHFEDANSFGYQVANRYTREDAKNIYDIYSTWSERGESGETRMKYIPGEYYESSYVHSNGFTDYFMAENSSGYWKLSRFGHIREDEYAKQNYIENYVIKDGLGIGMLYNNIEEKDRESRTIIEYDFFDTTTVQSLFGATEQRAGDFSIFNYVGNVESGLAYVEADLSDTRADGDIYMNSLGSAGRLVFDGDNDSRYSIPRYKWKDFNDMMIYGKDSKFKFTLFDFLEYDISMVKNMNLIYRKRGMVYSDYPIIRTQKILNDISWMISSCPEELWLKCQSRGIFNEK